MPVIDQVLYKNKSQFKLSLSNRKGLDIKRKQRIQFVQRLSKFNIKKFNALWLLSNEMSNA